MQNHINALLAKLTISYRTINETYMCSIGMHAGQAQVLSVLWQRDGLSQAEIVRELCISPPTVNTLVNKLKKAKFVKCKKCPTDKRLMRVHLTKKGFEIRSKTEDKWKELEELMLRDFSDTEKVLILMLFEKIKNNLQTGTTEIQG